MDLLVKLKEEIHKLGLKNDLAIARFIYIRLGELFTYDPTYYTYKSKSPEQMALFDKKIDIRNVNDFNVVCSSWAHVYANLLNYFGIKALYKETSKSYYHAYVKFWIGKKAFVADMTTGLEDISNIKFGFHTTGFYYDDFLWILIDKISSLLNLKKLKNYFQAETKFDKKINYCKGIYTDEILFMIKREIYSSCYQDTKDLINNVFKAVMLIINVERENVRFSDGENFIVKMLEYFLDSHFEYIGYTQLYDGNRQEFMGIYINIYQNLNNCFLYHKDGNDFYKLEPIDQAEAKWLCENYICSEGQILKLIKKL